MANKISCVLMAGGKSSRMGTDKSWVNVAKEPMINRVINIITPQVDEIIINTNSTDDRYNKLGFNVHSDSITDFAGPLAGVLTGLENCKNDIVLSIPVDCPLLPDDLVSRMLDKMNDDTDVVVASSNSRTHPVIALWKKDLKDNLSQSLKNDIRKVDMFTKELNCNIVDFDDYKYDVFMNVNTQDDLDKVNGYING
ncbi:MAG: molybdenum cofactor guanylyltransferase MobA [Alphaproteobacteria bacterium]